LALGVGYRPANQVGLGPCRSGTARRSLSEHAPHPTRHGDLNTHGIGSLYEAFEPEQAHRLAKRIEIHYTPKHGSWLNIAECELSVLSRQCLNRRVASKDELKREVLAWQDERNAATIAVDWQFTTADARVKLKRLYPKPRT